MDPKYSNDYWESFPELSPDERPLLLQELGLLARRNPFGELFNLQKKLVIRIGIGLLLALLHLLDICFPSVLFVNDLPFRIVLFILLLYYIIYHYRIFRKAGFKFITARRLTSFLKKWEILVSDYIYTAIPISLLAGFYTILLLKKSLPGLYTHNSLMAVPEACVLSGMIYWAVNKYGFTKPRRILATIRSFRKEISAIAAIR